MYRYFIPPCRYILSLIQIVFMLFLLTNLITMEKNSDSSSTEETDRVVFEAPVFLSKLLNHKLNIFQHQVRPEDKPIDNPVLRSRIKPRQHEVELEVSINTSSPNYDQKKGTDLASKATDAHDDFDKNGARLYPCGMVDKHILRSGPYNPERNVSYAAGRFYNGELHICPIEAIVQLQPSYAHSDAVYSRDHEKKTDGKDDSVEEPPMEKISVKFMRHESERTKKLKKMTYSYYMKKRAEERWINTQYFPSGTPEAEVERQKLICELPQNEVNDLNLDNKKYLKTLVPYTPAAAIPSASTSGMVSIASLKHKNWHEKLRTLFLSAKIIQFEKLTKLLCDDWNPKEAKDVLRAIQTHAVLVCGNWVVRSDVIYPEKSESRYNGVPASLMCRARDFLLLMFQQYKYVGQVKFVNSVKIPREEAREMLTEIASYHENKGWDLLYPYDHDFTMKYPEVVARQKMLWEERKNSLELSFKEQREPCKATEVCKRQRKKSGRESSVSGNESCSESIPQRRRKKSNSYQEALFFK